MNVYDPRGQLLKTVTLERGSEDATDPAYYLWYEPKGEENVFGELLSLEVVEKEEYEEKVAQAEEEMSHEMQ